MDFIGGAILVAAVLNLFAGVFVLFYGKRSATNSSFVFLVLSVFLWAVSIFFFRSVDAHFDFWVVALHVAPIAMAIAYFSFATVFPYVRTPYSTLYFVACVVSGAILTLLLLWTDLIIDGYFVADDGLNRVNYGPYFMVYRAFIFTFFIWGSVDLLRKYYHSEGEMRSQMWYVIVGTLAPVLVGLTTNLILPMFDIYIFNWVGQVFTIGMVLMIAFAIVRYNFLNTSLFSSQVFIVALIIITFLEIFSSRTLEELLLRVLFFLFVLFFSQRLIAGIGREAKQKKQLEDLSTKLSAANAELQKLDDAKSEFISIASHQLRTPLTAIKGYLSLVQEGLYGPVSDKIQDIFDKVYTSNERLIQLVEDLLNISRIESGRMEYHFEKIDISEIVLSLRDTFILRTQKKGLDFVIDTDTRKKCYVYADINKIREVISNLIDNAVKYTEKGFVHVSVVAGEGKVSVIVTDSGIGIPKEVMKSLFKKFSRGKDQSRLHVEGTGLGLYVSKSIVQEHGGDIYLTSQGPTAGSTFVLVLPTQEKYVKDPTRESA